MIKDNDRLTTTQSDLGLACSGFDQAPELTRLAKWLDEMDAIGHRPVLCRAIRILIARNLLEFGLDRATAIRGFAVNATLADIAANVLAEAIAVRDLGAGAILVGLCKDRRILLMDTAIVNGKPDLLCSWLIYRESSTDC